MIAFVTNNKIDKWMSSVNVFEKLEYWKKNVLYTKMQLAYIMCEHCNVFIVNYKFIVKIPAQWFKTHAQFEHWFHFQFYSHFMKLNQPLNGRSINKTDWFDTQKERPTCGKTHTVHRNFNAEFRMNKIWKVFWWFTNRLNLWHF